MSSKGKNIQVKNQHLVPPTQLKFEKNERRMDEEQEVNFNSLCNTGNVRNVMTEPEPEPVWISISQELIICE